jgi:integrase
MPGARTVPCSFSAEALAQVVMHSPRLVFTSPDGEPLRHSNFYRRIWMPASVAIGLSGTYLHDLRHSAHAALPGRSMARHSRVFASQAPTGWNP